MTPRRSSTGFAALALPLVLSGCIYDPPEPAKGTPVFNGSFATGVEPQAFDTSRLNALSIDTYQHLGGQDTVRIDVPAASATPGFAGGPWVASAPRDLSDSTALVFWTKSARPAVIDKVGFGLSFTAPSTHWTTLYNLPVTEQWTQHAIPLPDPARLGAEHGLFWYADRDPVTFRFWLAGMGYLVVDASLLDMQPSFGTSALTILPGQKAPIPLILTYTDLDGTRRSLDGADPGFGAGPSPSFFAFASSDSSVANVDTNGKVTGVAPGQALVSARLGGVPLPRELLVNVVASIPAPPPTPATAAPAPPARPAGSVLSLFSDSYANLPINFTHTDWSVVASETTPSILGNPTKKYTGLRFVGIDFTNAKIDASGMTHLHLDLWTPNATKFGVKLVSFPATGGSMEATVSFNGQNTYGGTQPLIRPGSWISLDVPLSFFGDLPLDTLGQLLWLDNGAVPPGGDEDGTFFVDNVYFHR